MEGGPCPGDDKARQGTGADSRGRSADGCSSDMAIEWSLKEGGRESSRHLAKGTAGTGSPATPGVLGEHPGGGQRGGSPVSPVGHGRAWLRGPGGVDRQASPSPLPGPSWPLLVWALSPRSSFSEGTFRTTGSSMAGSVPLSRPRLPLSGDILCSS